MINRFIRWQVRYAGAMMSFCMLGFLVAVFGVGFATHAAPAMVGGLAYGAVMFLVGAFGNALVVYTTKKE